MTINWARVCAGITATTVYAVLAIIGVDHAPKAAADQALPEAPVELTDLTTETTEVLQMPDGTFQLTSNLLPVRVEQDGDWVDIDTDLSTNSAGMLTPEATATPVAMSPGGNGPMLTLTEGGSTLKLWWESPLPSPIVDANSAIYANVRPGVDLVLSAESTGFSQALVVHDRAAALDLLANPAQIRYTGTGLSFSLGEDSTIKATTSDGTVLRSAPPVMWDSSGSDQPDAENPEEAKVHRVQTTLAAGGEEALLTLAPPSAVVDNPSTTYPLFLDPQIEPNANHYLTVHSKGWDYYDDNNQVMRVGYCGWSECNTSIQGNARSYFSFNVSPITGKSVDAVVYDATVYVKQVHNALSTSTPVNLMKATGFGPNTNYPGPVGVFLQQKSSNAGYGSNPSANLLFSNADVLAYLQQAANQDDTIAQFALSAPAPDNKNYWKKFANNPELVIHFGFPPTTPTGLGEATAITCGSTNYVHDLSPLFTAKANDLTGNPLRYHFQLYKGGNTAVYATNPSDIDGADNTVVTWDYAANTSTPGLLSQGSWSYRVMANSNDPQATNTPSEWSGEWNFTIDTSPPALPTVGSFSYPPEYWGAPTNQPGSFQLAGTADVAGFAWALDSGSPPAVNNSDCTYSAPGLVKATAGKATLTMPSSLSSGPHTLKVQAFDAAHNRLSAATVYTFYVANTTAGFTPGSSLQQVESMTTSQGNTNSSSTVDAIASGGAFTTLNAISGSPESPSWADFAFTVPSDAYYAPGVWIKTGPGYGRMRFSINRANDPNTDDQHPMLNPDGSQLVVDANGTAGNRFVPLGEYLPYEGVLLKSGTVYNLHVEVVGTSGTGYAAGLDALTLSPFKQAAFASLAAAFNNDGIGADTTTSAKLTSSTNKSLSNVALADAGISPGTSVNIGGVTFPISAANSDGYDNVVSSGQTIQMPANQGAENVYLLATTTCGTIGPNSTRKLTIQYSDSVNVTTSDGVMPGTVPDWLSPAPADTTGIPAHRTTTHHLAGTTATQPGATLYVMKFPTNPDNRYDNIVSVTLPRVGTTFTNDTCGTPGTQALHVVSIGMQ